MPSETGNKALLCCLGALVSFCRYHQLSLFKLHLINNLSPDGYVIALRSLTVVYIGSQFIIINRKLQNLLLGIISLKFSCVFSAENHLKSVLQILELLLEQSTPKSKQVLSKKNRRKVRNYKRSQYPLQKRGSFYTVVQNRKPPQHMSETLKNLRIRPKSPHFSFYCEL